MDNQATTHTYTDEELIVRSRTDNVVFGILIERYESKLNRYIRRITNVTDEDRQDILQNVFLKVYTNLNAFDESLSFNSWIYRITRNEVIDWSRRSQHQRDRGYIDTDDTLFDQIESYEHFLKDLELQENKHVLLKGLNALKPISREVLMLQYFEEKSYQEMSDILKKPVPTISTLLRREKQELKSWYSNNQHNHD